MWLADERLGDAYVAFENDVEYGTTGLTIDLYVPSRDHAWCGVRPLLVMVHGGGWVTGQKEWLDERAQFYARHGIVVATLDYRKTTSDELCKQPNPDRALYRVVQDLHAAIQYVASRADELGIDTDRVLLYGNSAGSLTALALSFGSDEEFASSYAAIVESEGPMTAVSKHPDETYEVAAVFAQAGALARSSWLAEDDARPTPALYLAHSEEDESVPFGVGPTAICEGADVEWFGSGWIRAQSVMNAAPDGCVVLAGVEGAVHDLDDIYGEVCNSVELACEPSLLDEAATRFFSVATAGACEPQSWSCTADECALDATEPILSLSLLE